MLSVSQRNSLQTAAEKYAQNVEGLRSYLGARGISHDTATRVAHLGHVLEPEPGHERFEGWMSLPYVTPAGVVAMKFRCISDHDCHAVGCQRYDAPSGQKARLYGAGSLAHTDSPIAAVVEGEFKAMVVQQELGIPAVGTSAGLWREHWARCLADFDEVLVIADNDDAGVKHAKDKVLKALPHQGRLVVPPLEFPKIDDWLITVGAETVKKEIGL